MWIWCGQIIESLTKVHSLNDLWRNGSLNESPQLNEWVRWCWCVHSVFKTSANERWKCNQSISHKALFFHVCSLHFLTHTESHLIVTNPAVTLTTFLLMQWNLLFICIQSSDYHWAGAADQLDNDEYFNKNVLKKEKKKGISITPINSHTYIHTHTHLSEINVPNVWIVGLWVHDLFN